MPDNLVVSTLLSCVDATTKKQLTMADDTDYMELKERLILYERNSRSLSGRKYHEVDPKTISG